MRRFEATRKLIASSSLFMARNSLGSCSNNGISNTVITNHFLLDRRSRYYSSSSTSKTMSSSNLNTIDPTIDSKVYASNSHPPTTTDLSTPESIETTRDGRYMINDEGIPVHPVIEQYRQRGHPLVSADDIRKSGKNHKDFIWIPYPYTREKLLWIEVPVKGFYASSESDIEREFELDDDDCNDDSSSFLDGEACIPYMCIPPKRVGDPPISMRMTDPKKAWEESRVALKAHNDEMNKIKYPNGRPVYEFEDDSDLEYHQVYCMHNGAAGACMHLSHGGSGHKDSAVRDI